MAGAGGAGSLRALAWLSLEDNHLSTLPTELSQLSNLEYLSIYNNMQITALPLCMFSFKSLRCFRANQFFQVPKELLTGVPFPPLPNRARHARARRAARVRAPLPRLKADCVCRVFF